MKKFMVIFFILCIIGAGIYYYLSHLHDGSITADQKQKAIEALLGRRPVLTQPAQKTTWTQYRGQYFSVAYPPAATIYTHAVSSPSAGLLEILQFQSKEAPRYFFTIQVIPRNSIHSLGDLPGVRMRSLSPDIYKEKNDAIAGQSAMTFLKEDDQNVEKTAFIYSQGREYSLAITGVSPQILNIFTTIAGNFVLH